jgi:hypothetical protein
VFAQNATDFVDLLNNAILKPLISSQESDFDDPEELFVIDISQFNQLEDDSSEMEYTVDSNEETTEMNVNQTTDSSMSNLDTNEILKMTENYHAMRVKVANLKHTIQKQQDIIRDLDSSIKKRKITSDKKLNELKIKNEKCRSDFNLVFRDLVVAKKLISMEKYSRKLKRKLGEFGVPAAA